MDNIKIKNESLPIRCEICHKNDCFDPKSGKCARCENINKQCQKSKISDWIKQHKSAIKYSTLIYGTWMMVVIFIYHYTYPLYNNFTLFIVWIIPILLVARLLEILTPWKIINNFDALKKRNNQPLLYLYFFRAISPHIGGIIICLSVYIMASICFPPKVFKTSSSNLSKVSNNVLSSIKITILEYNIGGGPFSGGYEITIDGKGKVICGVPEELTNTIDDKGNTICGVKLRRKVTYISQQEVRKLLSYFDEANYFTFKDSYYQHAVTHPELIITSISVNGIKKRVDDYLGEDSPEELRSLEEKIGSIVSVKDLIKQAKQTNDDYVDACDEWRPRN